MIVENLDCRVRETAELIKCHVVFENTIRCTHQNDKNGNLIFEGNVIQLYSDWKYIVKYGEFHGTVGLGYYYGLEFYIERIRDSSHRVSFNTSDCGKKILEKSEMFTIIRSYFSMNKSQYYKQLQRYSQIGHVSKELHDDVSFMKYRVSLVKDIDMRIRYCICALIDKEKRRNGDFFIERMTQEKEYVIKEKLIALRDKIANDEHISQSDYENTWIEETVCGVPVRIIYWVAAVLAIVVETFLLK